MTASTAPLSAAGRELPKRWLAIIATIWGGQAASMITSYAAGYAVVWYITETTGSAIMLAAAAICAYLPQGLLSPFGGVIADKHNRKTVMIVADLSVGIVSLGLGIVILFGQVSFPLLMILVIVRSIGQAFHGPAMMAAMPLLVPEKHLLRINTLDQLLMSVASIGAPAFGIFLYTTIGFHSVMFLDFAGALVAVAGLALAKIPTVADETAENQHVLANLRDGWKALSATRGLVVLIAGITIGMMAFAPLGAIFPLMTYDHFGGDGYMASVVEAAFGVGMIAGSVVLMAWGGGKRLAGLIAVASLIVGVTTTACGFLSLIHIYGGVDACHGTAVGVLPDGEVELRVRLGSVVLGEPDGTPAQIGAVVTRHIAAVAVDHRLVAALLEAFAERPRARGERLAIHVVRTARAVGDGLVVVRHGQRQIAAGQQPQHELGFFARLFDADGLREEVRAHVQACARRVVDVLGVSGIGVQRALGVAAVAHAHEGEVHAVARHSAPVDGALMVGHVHA